MSDLKHAFLLLSLLMVLSCRLPQKSTTNLEVCAEDDIEIELSSSFGCRNYMERGIEIVFIENSHYFVRLSHSQGHRRGTTTRELIRINQPAWQESRI
jgi:hypothetical protein